MAAEERGASAGLPHAMPSSFAESPWPARLFTPGDADARDAALHEQIGADEPVWRGGVIDVHNLSVTLPDGAAEHRDVVRHPGGVAVVAVTPGGQVPVVRQYRTPFDAVTVEIPAGKLDPGEEPAVAARRELREETGFVADELVPLVSVAPSPGYSDEVVHVYLAHGLRFVGASPDADEFLNVDMVDMSELVAAVLDGSITDAKTVAGILAAHAREAALHRRSK